MQIGVIREHMDKKALNEADFEAIDLAERAVGDLRRRVPRSSILSGGALFQVAWTNTFRSIATGCSPSCIRTFRGFNRKPSTDRIATLVDMFFDPSLVPAGFTIGISRGVQCRNEQIHAEPLPQGAGRCNIKSLKDLIDKSQYYRDIRPEAGFIDRKAALEERTAAQRSTWRTSSDRFAYQQVVPCMAQETSMPRPAGNIPAISWVNHQPPLAGRTNSVWACWGSTDSRPCPSRRVSLLGCLIAFAIDGQRYAPNGAGSGETSTRGHVRRRPLPSRALFRIGSAYEAATKHRIRPPDFGPVPEL
jgi:hypothetical protein